MISPLQPPRIPRSLGTHDGTFHSDEVTAAALLLIADRIDRQSIVRSREPDVLARCEYVCDVGGIYDPQKKQFDHHQLSYKGPLSSAGMILEYLKNEKFFDFRHYTFLNNTFVRGVDAHDNGKEVPMPGTCTFSHIISNFSPIEYDAKPEQLNAAFFEALDFARGHIKRMINRFDYGQSCHKEVQEAMSKFRHCLIFDRAIPWIDLFFEMSGNAHPALFVIMPTGSCWKLRAIPPTNDDRMQVRLPLPEAWAGLLNSDLQKKTGIPGAIFCHKERFISVWKTKQDALSALKQVYAMYGVTDDDNI